MTPQWRIVIKVLAPLLFVFLFLFSFPPFEVPEGAYLFLVPVLVTSFWIAKSKYDRVIRFFTCWLVWGILLGWIVNFSSHLSTPLALFYGIIALLGLSWIVSLFMFGWLEVAIVFMREAPRRNTIYRVLLVPALASFWVVLEWLRTWIFSGFPWLPLSASQWDRSLLLQVSSWTGAYGVSFVLISFNIGLSLYLYRIVENRRKSWLRRISPEFYLAVFFLVGAIGLGTWSGQFRSTRSDPLKFAFVQPAVSGVDKWDRERVQSVLGDLKDLTTLASYLNPDFILWPETPMPYGIHEDLWTKDWIESIAQETDIALLFGGLILKFTEEDSKRYYNSVLYAHPETGIDFNDYYSKRKLVPFGERVPFDGFWGLLDTVVPVSNTMYPGSSPQNIEIQINRDQFSVGPLVCYEDLFPGLVRDQVLHGADLLFVVTNDLWFGTWAAAEQHAAHSVLRAVEFRRPVLRCGNAGWSGWIDEFGTIRHQMVDQNGSVYFSGVDQAEVTYSHFWRNRMTFYAKYGDWFVGLCLVFCSVLVYFWRQPNSCSSSV